MNRKKLITRLTALFFLLCFFCFYGCANHTDLMEVKEKKNTKGKENTEAEADDSKGEDGESAESDDSEKKLTLMLYMAADNDLESYALQNMKMLEEESSEALNVIVLLDRSEGYDETNGNWTDTRIFEVCKDEEKTGLIVSKRLSSPNLGLSLEENTELDMANPYVLKKFIEFVKSAYKAEKYALIIWGHGTGWRYSADDMIHEDLLQSRAVAIDDKTASYMTVSELGNAIRGQGINVIGFDTCFGAVFENVYELKDCAEYTVACPGLVPGSGWNYKELLKKLAIISSPDSPMASTREIADALARSSSVQTTVFINEKLNFLMPAFEDFSKALADSITNDNERKNVLNSLLASKTYRYFQYPCDLYLDFLEMANLYSESSDIKIQKAAKNFISKIEESAYCLDDLYDKKAGIGIHLIPLISAHSTAASHSPEYIKNPNLTNQGKFIKESLWWVPTLQGNSGSLLDKLFYTSY